MRESSERDMEEHGKDEEASDELKDLGALADWREAGSSSSQTYLIIDFNNDWLKFNWYF